MAYRLNLAIKFAFAADRTAELAPAGQVRNYTTVMGIGEKSQGKTATVKAAAQQIAQALGKKFVESASPGPDEFGFCIADLSGDTAESIAGLMDREEREGRRVTIFDAHHWFPRQGTGILVFDEWNRISPMAAPVLQQAADKHQLGPHTAPKGWTFVFIGNPPEGASGNQYQVNEGFDDSFFSRFTVLPVSIGKEDFVRYALSQGFRNEVVNFVATADDLLTAPEEGLRLESKFPIHPSSRALETVNNLLEGCAYAERIFKLRHLTDPKNEDMFLHLVGGALGKKTAIAMHQSLTSREKPLDAEDIMDNYSSRDAESQESPQDKVRRWSQPTNMDQALLATITSERVARYIIAIDRADREAIKRMEAKLGNLDAFLGDLRHEEVTMFNRTIQQHGSRGVKLLDIIQKYTQRNLQGIDAGRTGSVVSNAELYDTDDSQPLAAATA